MQKNELLFEKDKKIGFIGLGRSNMPVAQMLRAQGFRVSLRDKKEMPPIDGFDCFFGEHYLENICEDVLFLAPVLRPDIPEVLASRERGTYVTTEINEYLRRRKGKVIAVTGSDGKTTTTTLINEILKRAGVKTILGGNIGINLLTSIYEEDENTVTVCELSSFQLMKVCHSPDVAVITNISPNHLDWHRDMNEYIDAKKNIFRFMKSGKAVLCGDDMTSVGFAHEIPVPVVFTSGTRALADGVYFDGESIYAFGEKVLECKDILIPGRHNIYNYCAAIAAVWGLADKAAIKYVAENFPGVKHRIQLVREKDGVKYYNSSIDSSPTRTAAALNSFAQKVIVISGGYDKHIPLEPLGPLFEQKTKAAVLMGVTGKKIYEILKNTGYTGRIETACSMEDAVKKAHSLAENGDTVILSPAAASFDMFKDFEERGEKFVECVNGL
ncbi:MAG: UDP-N-acetylmuramoyl-L-alanine--D-glutamate ligase [Clostridia bacterium]|nr:UDP-N-acetylmuramoyl-L-alanine--D-glutamate ligase [Clostridia bacterium]MBR5031105.1 UDP-N-acetylmuramoyl-L-alanine--D-glutamate ligase [Clostridia bacterium]